MSNFTAEAFSYMGIGICVVAARIWVRIWQQSKMWHLAADDFLMILVLVPYITEIILAYLVRASFHGLSNGGMTDEERATLSPDSTEYSWRVGGAKVQVAGWTVYVTTLWLIKSSVCAFYQRLTNSLVGYRTRIYCGYASIALTYVATILVIYCSCQPFHALWQINPNPGNLCQPARSKLYILMVMITNVLTDLYLVAIPVPILMRARLPLVQKLSLLVVFSGAFFVMAAGIVRGVLLLEDNAHKAKLGSAWAVRESFVAIVTSNLPVMWGWLTTKLKPWLGSLLSTKKSSSEPQAISQAGSQPLGEEGESRQAWDDDHLWMGNMNVGGHRRSSTSFHDHIRRIWHEQRIVDRGG